MLILRQSTEAAVIVTILIVPLPFSAAMFPRVGCYISRRGNRLRFLGIGLLCGAVGLAARSAGLMPSKVGLYLLAPLWQITVIQIAYFVWYKIFKRPPVNVYHNWDDNVIEDRILAMAILLLGMLGPAFVIGR